MIEVNRNSVQVNKLELFANDQSLGFATGLIVQHTKNYYLLTNWHVLSGRNPFSNQPLDKRGTIPDKLKITYLNKELSETLQIAVELVDKDGQNTWSEHPSGSSVDLAALKVNEGNELTIRPFDLSLSKSQIRPSIGDTVFVIGFPFGHSSYNDAFPIWKTGHIASEPELPFNKKPATLIDVTGREGMSGSPVIIKTRGPYRSWDNSVIMGAEEVTLFLGIYSGRLLNPSDQKSSISSELGLVWTSEAISQLLEHAGKKVRSSGRNPCPQAHPAKSLCGV